MFPDDLTVSALGAAMRGMSLRQDALSQNVANAETPGYRRVDVSFEGSLSQAIAADRGEGGATSDPRLAEGAAGTQGSSAVDALTPTLEGQDGTVMRYDGGNVDPDAEMSALAANQLAYQTVTALLGKRFSQLSYVINGR